MILRWHNCISVLHLCVAVDTQAASIVCDSHRYTYHSISLSADDANRACREQYDGRRLSTDIQQLSCASQLLTTSQILSNNNVSHIPVYTDVTNGSRCTTYQPSTNTTHQDSCKEPRPTICVSSKFPALLLSSDTLCMCVTNSAQDLKNESLRNLSICFV